MRICLIAILLAAGRLSAQVVPWNDITGGWIHSETAQTISLRQGPLGLNPAGTYHLTQTVMIPPGVDTANLAITVGILHGAYRLSVNGTPLGETPDYARRFEPYPSAQELFGYDRARAISAKPRTVDRGRGAGVGAE